MLKTSVLRTQAHKRLCHSPIAPRMAVTCSPCNASVSQYFSSLTSCSRRSAMTRSAMQSHDRHLWTSRVTNKTKLHLYRVFALPIMLFKSECWAINKAYMQRIDAVDQWCLRRILDICWHDYVRNVDIHRNTNQPPLSSIIKSYRLSLSLGILHEWMRTQMLAEPSSNLLQRTGGDHRGGCAQLG